MALGAGIDIIAISRMRCILESSGKQPFLDKVYTPGEIQRSVAHRDPVTYLAKTFAAKEAIFKTFCIGSDSVQFKEIDIQDGEFGEPLPVLSGGFAQLAAERKVSRVHLSLSYDGDYAIAMAVLSEQK